MVILTIYVYHDLKPRLNQRLNWPKMMKKGAKKPIFPLPILRDQKIAISILVQRLIDRSSILDLTTLATATTNGEATGKTRCTSIMSQKADEMVACFRVLLRATLPSAF